MANCNELSLSASIETCHSHATLNLKATIIYCIVTCGVKTMCAFAMSSVVRDTTNIKIIGMLPMMNDKFLVKESQRYTGCSAVLHGQINLHASCLSMWKIDKWLVLNWYGHVRLAVAVSPD